MSKRQLLAVLLTLLVAVVPGATAKRVSSSSVYSSSAASMERKLEHIKTNSALVRPNPAPTEFTEQEVNAYVASGDVKLPAGVQAVTFQGEPGIITGNARVDFDQLRTGRGSNPLLSIFGGTHDVVVVAHAYGAGGKGFVHVDSVLLDGVEIPPFVLELFVEKYLRPKYPNLGIDSQFPLPDRVDAAAVELHKLVLTQK
jgi:hypothetical protein